MIAVAFGNVSPRCPRAVQPEDATLQCCDARRLVVLSKLSVEAARAEASATAHQLNRLCLHRLVAVSIRFS